MLGLIRRIRRSLFDNRAVQPPTEKQCFDHAMWLLELLETAPPEGTIVRSPTDTVPSIERASAIKKFIKIMLREEQARQIALPIVSDNSGSDRLSKFHRDWSFMNLPKYFSMINYVSHGTDGGPVICLANELVIAFPHEANRLRRSLSALGIVPTPGGENTMINWREDYINHRVHLWSPFGFYTVEGGNHSISAGIIDGVGKVHVRTTRDISNLLMRVDTDGLSYYDVENKCCCLGPVTDGKMAAVWRAGRILATRFR